MKDRGIEKKEKRRIREGREKERKKDKERKRYWRRRKNHVFIFAKKQYLRR